MKKFFAVVVVVVVAISLFFSVSCTKKSSNPAAPAATATPGYSFTSGTEGFLNVTTGDSQAFSGLQAITTDGAVTAAGCLTMSCDFEAANANLQKGMLYIDLATPVNLTGKTISMWVKIPAAIANVDYEYQWALYIQDAADHYNAGGYGDFVAADATTWKHLTWAAAAGSVDITNVTKIGIQVFRNTPHAAQDVTSGTFYADDVTYY